MANALPPSPPSHLIRDATSSVTNAAVVVVHQLPLTLRSPRAIAINRWVGKCDVNNIYYNSAVFCFLSSNSSSVVHSITSRTRWRQPKMAMEALEEEMGVPAEAGDEPSADRYTDGGDTGVVPHRAAADRCITNDGGWWRPRSNEYIVCSWQLRYVMPIASLCCPHHITLSFLTIIIFIILFIFYTEKIKYCNKCFIVYYRGIDCCIGTMVLADHAEAGEPSKAG